jgi:hypothetical protein
VIDGFTDCGEFVGVGEVKEAIRTALLGRPDDLEYPVLLGGAVKMLSV